MLMVEKDAVEDVLAECESQLEGAEMFSQRCGSQLMGVNVYYLKWLKEEFLLSLSPSWLGSKTLSDKEEMCKFENLQYI